MNPFSFKKSSLSLSLGSFIMICESMGICESRRIFIVNWPISAIFQKIQFFFGGGGEGGRKLFQPSFKILDSCAENRVDRYV
jgi:hypothetical protein